MQTLTAILEQVAQETGDGPQGTAQSGKGGNEFSWLKAKISSDVKSIRMKLKERDELLMKGATGTKATVQASHQIRQQLREVREDASKLMALQRKEASKSKGKEKANEQADRQQETVELVFLHIEECELLEKKRYTSKNSEARVELFAGLGNNMTPTYTSCTAAATGSCVGGAAFSRGMDLPDIDAETQQGLQVLDRKNEAIDQQLEVVSEGVHELKSIALHMRDEVKVQNAMVDEITHKVESASSQLGNLNKKMKKTLAQTRSADRFCLDFILVVILLAIVGYIISMVTGNR